MSPIKWALGLAFLCLALAGSALAATTEPLYVLEGKNIVTYSVNNTAAVSKYGCSHLRIFRPSHK